MGGDAAGRCIRERKEFGPGAVEDGMIRTKGMRLVVTFRFTWHTHMSYTSINGSCIGYDGEYAQSSRT